MKNLSGLGLEFFEKGRVSDCPVFDMHAHMGRYSAMYLPFPEPREMVERMALAGVKMAAVSHHSALCSPGLDNDEAVDAARKFPGFFKAYRVLNPNYPDDIARTLSQYDLYSDACIGLKLHPDGHGTPLTDSRYAGAFDFAEGRGLLVLTHTWGGSACCGAKEVRKIAGSYKNLKLILGHSIHGEWDEAANIAAEHDNVYLDLCAVLDERAGILEKFVSVAGSGKILFGTDFPWFNHHYYIGGVLAAGITDVDRRNIFYRNAEKLLGIRDA